MLTKKQSKKTTHKQQPLNYTCTSAHNILCAGQQSMLCRSQSSWCDVSTNQDCRHHVLYSMWQLGDCRGPAYSQSSALLFIIVINIIIISVYKLVFLSFISPLPTPSSCTLFCQEDTFRNQNHPIGLLHNPPPPPSLPHSDPALPTWSKQGMDIWTCQWAQPSRISLPCWYHKLRTRAKNTTDLTPVWSRGWTGGVALHSASC